MSDHCYMFSYGMNTNLTSMAVRCPRAELIGPAVLPEHVFVFKYHADVEHDRGSAVHGLLWRLDDHDLAAIDLVEGYPRYYTRELLEVHTDDYVYDAWVYKMDCKDELIEPSEGYLNMVIEGYKQNGLRTQQVYQALEWCNGRINQAQLGRVG